MTLKQHKFLRIHRVRWSHIFIRFWRIWLHICTVHPPKFAHGYVYLCVVVAKCPPTYPIGPWHNLLKIKTGNFQTDFSESWLMYPLPNCPPINDNEANRWQVNIIQVMVWCSQATSHYLDQCCPRFMASYGVTRPQWIHPYCSGIYHRHSGDRPIASMPVAHIINGGR